MSKNDFMVQNPEGFFNQPTKKEDSFQKFIKFYI